MYTMFHTFCECMARMVGQMSNSELGCSLVIYEVPMFVENRIILTRTHMITVTLHGRELGLNYLIGGKTFVTTILATLQK